MLNNVFKNYSGPTTTLESNVDGRLKVDTAGMIKRKKKIIKKNLKSLNRLKIDSKK